MIKIAFTNYSTVVSDDDLVKAVAAYQVQMSSHFAEVWGLDATLLIADKETRPAGAWQIAVLDNSDQADALGYHDLTSDGLPFGKVFAKSALDAGLAWTVTGSHELLEMRLDPDINLTVFREELGVLLAYEDADACEADEFGYKINDVLVSDFVYPSWFESFWQPNSTQFDYRNKITEPFQLLPGGYIGYYDLKGGNGWQQMTARGAPKNYKTRPPVGSRRERRRIPRKDWVRSTV